MKNWQAAIRTWVKRDKEEKAKNVSKNYKGYEERKYSNDELNKLFDNPDEVEF